MENAFDAVFERFEKTIAVSEQAAQAFFAADDEVMEFPGIHLEGFFHRSKRVELQPYGLETILWRKKAPIEFQETILLLINYPKIAEEMKMLDEILEYTPLTHIELEAFMRDELRQGNEELPMILNLCVPDIQNRRCFTEEDRQKLQNFKNLAGKLWELVKEDFPRTEDEKITRLRSYALKIWQKHRKWSRSNGIFTLGDNTSRLEIIKVPRITRELRKILNILNIGFLQKLYETKIIATMLREIKKDVDLLENPIDRTDIIEIPELQNDNGSLKKKRKFKPNNPENSIYNLKISLLGTQPKIWRSVEVKGSTTLISLHDIIQNIMGWENYHLHRFWSHSLKTYSEEEQWCLHHIVEDAGDRFFYEYDFGDRWQHEILLKKVSIQDETKEYPICTSGQYASPPEDCGGIYGFRHLLAVMQKPRSHEYLEIVEWLGKPFDLKAFDIQKINSRLHRNKR